MFTAMLQELHIRNFAIIDDLQLLFGPGLNILTGETGAGKSIIIDAIGLLLGNRAAAESVRAGTDRAEIEATFALPASEEHADLHVLLEEQGLDDPESPQWLVLSREVRTSGRNVCRVNGRAVSLQILSDITARLVDLHGQGEHLSLLRPRTHIRLLDRYAGLLPQRQKLVAKVSELRGVRNELRQLRADARSIAQRVDLLRFQADEINDAGLEVGEEGDLDSERRRLSNAEALLKLAHSAQAIVSEGDGETPCAIDLVGEAAGRVDKIAGIDPDMEPVAVELQGLAEQLSDVGRTLQDYAEQLEFNPQRLAEVEIRLEMISNLKRKYGDDIEQILAFGARAEQELEELDNSEARSAALEATEAALLREIGGLAEKLSAARRKAGAKMAAAVETELAALRMDRARFAVRIEQSPSEEGVILKDGSRVSFDATGIDQVEFLISANPGEPLKPMARVASGGETARLMLALKGVLANADSTATLIFDEIDQGIGGRVGAVVGQKLWKLTGQPPAAHAHQVLCITHLPQLAAYGDRHYTVQKQILDNGGDVRTRTHVDVLEGESRILELMQMLGATTAAGRQSVEEMLTEVVTEKSKTS